MAVCQPLSAIETPRVSDRDGNIPKGVGPVYTFDPLGGQPPLTPISSGANDVTLTKSSVVQSDPLKGKYFFSLRVSNIVLTNVRVSVDMVTFAYF